MSDVTHARISPSGAERWIQCPPSVRMGDNMPNKSSVYADAGTLAHKVGETIIKKRLGMISPLECVTILNECMQHKLYDNKLRKYADEYADFVCEKYAEVKAACPSALIFVEVRVDLSAAIPEGFGYTDVVIIADDLMYQIDFKFGEGIPVSAEENEQQMLYAYGSIQEFGFIYDIRRVEVVIYQPRIDNINSWLTTPEYIQNWVDMVASPAAKLAAAGEGAFKPGSHCQFCPGRPVCRTLAEDNLRIAADDFRPAETLSDTEISEILLKAEQFTGWIKAVKDYAIQTAKDGRIWPGFKLVRGQSKRTYTDTAKVIETLVNDAYYDPKQVSKTEPLGVTEMQEFLGKKIFDKYLTGKGLVIKPDGAPTLAPLTDKRPAIGSHDQAIKDFS